MSANGRVPAFPCSHFTNLLGLVVHLISERNIAAVVHWEFERLNWSMCIIFRCKHVAQTVVGWAGLHSREIDLPVLNQSPNSGQGIYDWKVWRVAAAVQNPNLKSSVYSLEIFQRSQVQWKYLVWQAHPWKNWPNVSGQCPIQQFWRTCSQFGFWGAVYLQYGCRYSRLVSVESDCVEEDAPESSQQTSIREDKKNLDR
jgi:hypothetical protein